MWAWQEDFFLSGRPSGEEKEVVGLLSGWVLVFLLLCCVILYLYMIIFHVAINRIYVIMFVLVF